MTAVKLPDCDEIIAGTLPIQISNAIRQMLAQ